MTTAHTSLPVLATAVLFGCVDLDKPVNLDRSCEQAEGCPDSSRGLEDAGTADAADDRPADSPTPPRDTGASPDQPREWPAPDLTCAGTSACAPGLACKGGQCTSLAAGLVGHWKLDEGDGTLVADSSGNGSDGSFNAGAMWSSGCETARFSNPHSLALDGVDDVVVVPDPRSGILDFGTGSFSVSLWVYITANTSSFDNVVYKGGGNRGNPGYAIELGTGSWTWNIQDEMDGAQAGFTNAPIMDRWVHLVGLRDAGTREIRTYTAGTLKDTRRHPPGSVSNAKDLRFGSDDAPKNWVHGRIDDIRIYNRALAAEEIAALAAGQ